MRPPAPELADPPGQFALLAGEFGAQPGQLRPGLVQRPSLLGRRLLDQVPVEDRVDPAVAEEQHRRTVDPAAQGHQPLPIGGAAPDDRPAVGQDGEGEAARSASIIGAAAITGASAPACQAVPPTASALGTFQGMSRPMRFAITSANLRKSP
jgi:hypothetical protein